MMDTSRFLDGYSAFGHIRRVIRQKYGSQRNFARSLGISEQHLSDMLNGRGNISDVVMLACGLRPRVVYEVMPGSETEGGDVVQDVLPPARREAVADAETAHFLRSSYR